MQIIKGPINKENLLKKLKVKLPFSAKNFKSSKMPDNVDLNEIEMKNES